MTNLEVCIDYLLQELSQAKSIVKRFYDFNFQTATDQVKHFFVDKELNFDLFYLSKFMLDILN